MSQFVAILVFLASLATVISVDVVIDSTYCTDTWIDSDSSVEVFGQDDFLSAYESVNPFHWRLALIKFRIYEYEGGTVPDDASIVSATLSLSVKSIGTNSLFAYTGIKEWSENTAYATFVADSDPTPNSVSTEPKSEILAQSGATVAEMNVTENVVSWANNTSNYGWVLISSSGFKRSSEGATLQDWAVVSCDGPLTNRPTLNVTYLPRNIQPIPNLSPISIVTFEPIPALPINPTSTPSVPTSTPSVPTTCRFFFDDGFSKPNNGSLYVYSHACTVCSGPGISLVSVDTSSISINRIPVITPRAIPNNGSVRFCFFVPRISLGSKRITLQMTFTLNPSNMIVSYPIDYNPAFAPILDCEKFKCDNESITIPESIWIRTPVIATNDLVVDGNLTLYSSGTISIDAGTTLEVTGCAKIQGSIEVDISSIPSIDEEIPIILSECIEEPSENIFVVTSNSQDGCTTFNGEQKVSSYGLGLLITRTESCEDSDDGLNYLAWLIPVVVISAILLVILIIVAVFFIRKYMSHQEMAKIEFALNTGDNL